MKIGFSFGRCVASIVRGEVNIDDVLCIIARTHMPSTEAVKSVIRAYLYEPGYLMGLDPEACESVGLELWISGRVLEPRTQGISVMQAPRQFVWMDLYPTVADVQNPSIREAWESYRILIELAEQVPESGDAAHRVFHHSPKLNLNDDGQEISSIEK